MQGRSAGELKAMARDLFDGDLAEEVTAGIEQDEFTAGAVASAPGGVGGVAPLSVRTLYLGDLFYWRLRPGRIAGRPTVTWDGMDDFVYEPSATAPFSFTRHDGRVITPQRMRTDGGSIPRILRGMRKFSSWGYAPAFIIHDWLFEAKKCPYPPDHDWAFRDTARVMAEVMKTLMEVGYENHKGERARLPKDEDVTYLMYLAVVSPFARNLWADDSTASCIAR